MLKSLKFKKEIAEERRRLFEEMRTMEPKDHAKWTQLKEKYDQYEKMENPSGHISRSDLFNAAVSVGTVLLVLYYEEANIIKSKAFSWLKLKK